MEIYIEEENGKVLAGEIRLKRQIQGGELEFKTRKLDRKKKMSNELERDAREKMSKER